MEQKNRISVRINGKQRSTERDNKETAATKEEKNFHWVLPEENHSGPSVVPLKQKPKVPEWGKKKKTAGQAPKLPLHRKKKFGKAKTRKRKKQPSVPKKQWASAFSAIVIGVIMGMIVLSIFTDHHPIKTTDGGSSTVSKQNIKEQAGTSVDSGKPVRASNLDLTLQIIQGAAFSTRANGQTAADTLKNEGFAAVLNQANNKFHLFIGAGLSEKNTDALGNLYKQQGQDVYVKTFSIQVNGEQLKPEVSRFLGEAKPVMETLMAASVQGLTSGETGLTAKDWNGVKAQIKQLKQDVTANTKPVLNALDTAVTDIGNYRSNSDSSSLWQAQQMLLEAMLDYQKTAQ